MIRKPRMKPRNFLARRIGARRIVRVGNENDARPFGHGGKDCVNIGRIIPIRRDDRSCTDAPDRDFIDGKAIADVDHLIARAGKCTRRLVQHFIRTRAANDAIRVKAVSLCDGFAQGSCATIGIAFEACRLCGKSGARLFARPQRVFVGGKLGRTHAAAGR